MRKQYREEDWTARPSHVGTKSNGKKSNRTKEVGLADNYAQRQAMERLESADVNSQESKLTLS